MNLFFDNKYFEDCISSQTEEIKRFFSERESAIMNLIDERFEFQLKEIEQLKNQVQLLEDKLARINQSASNSHCESTPKHIITHQAGTNTKRDQKQEKPELVSEQFYAIMEDDLQLVRVDNSHKTHAQFIIRATGDNGVATFNDDSLQFCLDNIEGEVMPYFDCNVKSRTPSVILAEVPVKVSKSSNGIWIMEKPIVVTIE